MIPGIAVGGICSVCWETVVRRARRISRWVAIGTTLPLAVYMTVTLPAERTARLMGLVFVLIWFLLSSLIARRVAVEWLK